MSRGSWASVVARCEAACAARSVARRKRMDERLRQRKRAYAEKNAARIKETQRIWRRRDRERRQLARMMREAMDLPPEIRSVYFQSCSDLRVLILEQNRDAAFTFRTGEPDIHYMAEIGAI